MLTVIYQHQLHYAHDRRGRRFPRLSFRISNPRLPASAVDVQAYLDSGTEKSLFSGWIGTVLGIDILSGSRVLYETAAGSHLAVTLHPVQLVHDDLGSFELDVGFSSHEIRRNLLGRDFFNLVQIGFREHHLSFFVTPSP